MSETYYCPNCGMKMNSISAGFYCPSCGCALSVGGTRTENGYKQQQLQQGWICPKCGAVMSPNQPYCINCTKFNTTISD